MDVKNIYYNFTFVNPKTMAEKTTKTLIILNNFAILFISINYLRFKYIIPFLRNSPKRAGSFPPD